MKESNITNLLEMIFNSRFKYFLCVGNFRVISSNMSFWLLNSFIRALNSEKSPFSHSILHIHSSASAQIFSAWIAFLPYNKKQIYRNWLVFPFSLLKVSTHIYYNILKSDFSMKLRKTTKIQQFRFGQSSHNLILHIQILR